MSDTIITTGRVTRAKFWPVFLPYLIWLALLVLLSATGGAVLFYLTAAALLPVYLLIIRGRAIGRLHDVGVSAFFYWMLIIVEILVVLLMGMFPFLWDGAAVASVAPVLAVILSILLFGFGAVLHVALLVFFLLPSQAGANDYGENSELPGVVFMGTSWGGIIEDMLKGLHGQVAQEAERTHDQQEFEHVLDDTTPGRTHEYHPR